MGRRAMLILAAAFGILMILILMTLDGLVNIFGTRDRHEVQVILAGFVLPIFAGTGVIMAAIGGLAKLLGKAPFGTLILGFASVFLAFAFGSFHAYAAGARDPRLVAASIAGSCAWIFLYERRVGRTRRRQVLLAGIAVAVWAAIRLIAG